MQLTRDPRLDRGAAPARAALIALIALAAACDRPDVLLICHNSNCVEPTDPANDDTLDAMRESLALEVNGRPLLDGIELDSFLRGSDNACLFAHDLAGAPNTPLTAAIAELAAFFARPGDLGHSGGAFHIFLELKPHVGPEKSERHSAEQLRLHAQCTWDAYRALADAAVANGRELEIYFASFAPELLREVLAMTPAQLPFPPRYDAFYGIPKPLDSVTRPLSEYAGLPISVVEIHAQWIHDAQHEGILSADVDLMLWMFSATVETFAAIDQYRPALVTTSEARLLRGWLER